MNQVILELPESLHVALEGQAEREGVALHDYLIDILMRFEAQRRVFDEMTTRYPREDAEAAVRELLAMRIPFEESED
jgi:hypothetical protein